MKSAGVNPGNTQTYLGRPSLGLWRPTKPEVRSFKESYQSVCCVDATFRIEQSRQIPLGLRDPAWQIVPELKRNHYQLQALGRRLETAAQPAGERRHFRIILGVQTFENRLRHPAISLSPLQ